jgi:hypothetical protein
MAGRKDIADAKTSLQILGDHSGSWQRSLVAKDGLNPEPFLNV